MAEGIGGLVHPCEAVQTGVGANDVYDNGLSPLTRQVQIGSQMRGRTGARVAGSG